MWSMTDNQKHQLEDLYSLHRERMRHYATGSLHNDAFCRSVGMEEVIRVLGYEFRAVDEPDIASVRYALHAHEGTSSS